MLVPADPDAVLTGSRGWEETKEVRARGSAALSDTLHLRSLPYEMLKQRNSKQEPPAEYYQVRAALPLSFSPNLPNLPLVSLQIAQYTCVYDALHRTVDCKPFVRTFLKHGVQMTEVTPTVNAGSRLPRGGFNVPTEASESWYVTSCTPMERA